MLHFEQTPSGSSVGDPTSATRDSTAVENYFSNIAKRGLIMTVRASGLGGHMALSEEPSRPKGASGESIMYTTCRVYSDARELAELIISNQNEVEKLLRAVPGFNSYYLVRTDDGFTSITICDTKEGGEQSNRVAAEWVRINGVGLRGTSPKIYAGPTPIAFTTGRAAISV